jgi:hypothetical protein
MLPDARVDRVSQEFVPQPILTEKHRRHPLDDGRVDASRSVAFAPARPALIDGRKLAWRVTERAASPWR